MGQRGEIFSRRIFCDEGKKTYFFNVKENRYRDQYLSIAESCKTETGFKRYSIVVFLDNMDAFFIALDKSINAIHTHKMTEKESSIDAGRRKYTFRFHKQGKPALQISEIREDDTGRRHQSIRIGLSDIDAFVEELGSVSRFMIKDK